MYYFNENTKLLNAFLILYVLARKNNNKSYRIK